MIIQPRRSSRQALAEVREFAQTVLHSPEYKASLVRRIVRDELHPAVETLLYHYAYGKPADTLIVDDERKAQDLTELTPEQLHERMKSAYRALLEVREEEEAKQDAPTPMLSETFGLNGRYEPQTPTPSLDEALGLPKIVRISERVAK